MRLTLSTIFIFFIFSCKKYPENTLWFKNPEKLNFVQGYITKYTVNGIDSLGLLNAYFNYYNLSQPNWPQIKTDIRNTKITAYSDDAYSETEWDLGRSGVMYTSEAYTSKKKKIKIFFYNDTLFYKKNIFINKQIEWDIIYLSNKNNKRKMKTTLSNGNTYEIQFN